MMYLKDVNGKDNKTNIKISTREEIIKIRADNEIQSDSKHNRLMKQIAGSLKR
jgi:hypothetical protein